MVARGIRIWETYTDALVAGAASAAACWPHSFAGRCSAASIYFNNCTNDNSLRLNETWAVICHYAVAYLMLIILFFKLKKILKCNIIVLDL